MLFCLWCLAVFLQEESVIAFVLQIAIFIARVPEVLLKNEIFSKSRKAVAPLPLNSAVFKEGPRGWVPFLLFPVALSPGKINSEWPKEHPEFGGEFGQGAAIPCTPPALPHSGNGSIHHWGSACLCLSVPTWILSITSGCDFGRAAWPWTCVEAGREQSRFDGIWCKKPKCWGGMDPSWARLDVGSPVPGNQCTQNLNTCNLFFFFLSFYRLRSWEWVCLAAGQLSLWTCKTMEM